MRNRNGEKISSASGFREDTVATRTVTVTLVCLFCAKERTISVARELGTGGRVYWQCFPCQENVRLPTFGKGGSAAE